MNYRRVLMLTRLGDDARAAFAAIRRFAPSAAQVIVLATRPARQLALARPPWERNTDRDEAADRALEGLREAAGRVAPEADVAVASDLTADGLADAVDASGIDLVVVGVSPVRTVPVVAELRRRRPVPVLCVGSRIVAPVAGSGNRLLCVGVSDPERRAIVRFLRDEASPGDRAVLLSPRPPSPEDLRQLREVSGIAADVKLTAASGQPLRRLLGPKALRSIDLVVLPRFLPAGLLRVRSGPPVLVLAPLRAAASETERAIDLPDLVDDGQLIRARLEYAAGVGRRRPIADQSLAFLHGGDVVARAESRGGEAELPSGIGPTLSVCRTQGPEAVDPLTPAEGQVAVVRAGPRPRLLFDAGIEASAVPLIRAVRWADPLAVRVRPVRSSTSLRARFHAAGLPVPVIDAGAVLGEGEAPDAPPQADAVRLARVAARMRAAGFPVAAIVYRGPHQPATQGFAAVRPTELGSLGAVPASQAASPVRASPAERLLITTGSDAISGNRIEVEFDNPTAHGWLLSAINGSRRRVHFQVYMALDDDIGRPVEAALAAAGSRGVTVRVLVDSLHGLHGSLGTRNPLLERLSSRPGVELRVSQPITRAPSLEDLKQRDHRKLVVVDGSMGLAGGRNLSHEYYAGFQEVPLTAAMVWRMVPWLDGGARVEGPAVAALERSFLQAWTRAGGAPFEIGDPAPAGSMTARVVVHHGLRDANTLETYLSLIETARSHLYVVNGFPLLLEIQHALLRALRRGVRVRTLFGNLTPKHGDEPFTGPWAAARTAWTSFMHSRMDALVAAGAECHELVVRSQPGWDPALGAVRPHVHAKAMSADGLSCAIGSANLDVVASYWESELLLVIEDPAVARAMEARLDDLLAGSDRIDPGDPVWRRRAAQRQWMRYWPGVLSG